MAEAGKRYVTAFIAAIMTVGSYVNPVTVRAEEFESGETPEETWDEPSVPEVSPEPSQPDPEPETTPEPEVTPEPVTPEPVQPDPAPENTPAPEGNVVPGSVLCRFVSETGNEIYSLYTATRITVEFPDHSEAINPELMGGIGNVEMIVKTPEIENGKFERWEVNWKGDKVVFKPVYEVKKPLAKMPLLNGRVPVYRLYNRKSGENLYTTSFEERDNLKDLLDWSYEGVAFEVPSHSENAMFRVYNPNTKYHHYTSSEKEVKALVEAGWEDEGIAWYTAEKEEGTAQYRLYNKSSKIGAHVYVSDEKEREELENSGWVYEGIGFYSVG